MTELSTIPRVPFNDLKRQHAPLAGELWGAFERVLGASAFILGEEVEQFEADFAEYCEVGHCVGVASGTAALRILLEASGIGRGDEVIVPAHTFIASALAVIHAGATPVCVDVGDASGLIDPAAVRAAISPRSAAILAVHLYGQTCAMEPLRALAERHGLALFEDAAQAHGATYRGARAGSLGAGAGFSFYPSKNLGAMGDGGAICTNDGELAARARGLRDLGRVQGSEHSTNGYNERLDGLQAAVLRVKLPHLDAWNDARRAAAARYGHRLAGIAQLPGEDPDSRSVFHVYAVRVNDRDRAAEHLRKSGVQCGIHYPVALPDHPALETMRCLETPVGRSWAERELSLPMFPELTESEIDLVARTLASVLALGEE